MAVKLIALDLDGTLLNDYRSISPRTAETLSKASRMGIHVVPITGRPFSGLPEALELIDGIEYTVTANGAAVRRNGEVILRRQFPASMCIELLDRFALRYDLAEMFIDGVGYEDERSYQCILRQFSGTPMLAYFEKSRRVVKDIRAFLSQKDLMIEAIAIMGESGEQCEELLPVMEEFPELKLVRPMPNYLEIMSCSSGKGNTLLELGDLLGIQPEEIMAIGDSDNDADMLRKVGIPVAMGNADDALKEIACYVTADNAHDGVAQAVEKFVFQN